MTFVTKLHPLPNQTSCLQSPAATGARGGVALMHVVIFFLETIIILENQFIAVALFYEETILRGTSNIYYYYLTFRFIITAGLLPPCFYPPLPIFPLPKFITMHLYNVT